MTPAALLAALALGAGPAEQPNTVALDLGVGSAVGIAGVTYARAFTPELYLETGVGVGGTGLQLSLMPKYGFPITERDRVLVGVGISLAIPGADKTDAAGHPLQERVLVPWLNVDAIGFEHWTDSGFTFSVAFGTTTALAGGDAYFAPTGDSSNVHKLFGYTSAQFRLGFGYSF